MAGGKFCPKCGFSNPPTRGACLMCYARLDQTGGGRQCPHCGGEVFASSNFCASCGGALAEGVTPVAGPAALAALVVETAGDIFGPPVYQEPAGVSAQELPGAEPAPVGEAQAVATAPQPAAPEEEAAEEMFVPPPPGLVTAEPATLEEEFVPPPPPPPAEEGLAPPPPPPALEAPAPAPEEEAAFVPPPPPDLAPEIPPPPPPDAVDLGKEEEGEDLDFGGWSVELPDENK